jgi:hypothetical protein
LSEETFYKSVLITDTVDGLYFLKSVIPVSGRGSVFFIE